MNAINILFDGPPSHESGRFIEVELDDGRGVNAGEWIERPNGWWALRITSLPEAIDEITVKCEDLRFVTEMVRNENDYGGPVGPFTLAALERLEAALRGEA